MQNYYKRNFLKNVILRIDFLNPIIELDEILPSEIGKEALNLFPIHEPVDKIGEGFQISQDKAEKVELRLKEWNFYGRSREKRLCITSKLMFMDFYKYTCFEDFSNHFMSIATALFETYKDLQITRLGLRYIDNIEFPNKNILNWKGYLNKNLLSTFDVPEDKSKIARALSVLELNYDNFMIRFQYGMHNPDFPATIKKKIFILDTDAYYQGLLNKNDIVELLPTFHNEIKKLFENSITDKMRSILNEE